MASRRIHTRGPFIKWNEKYVENVFTVLHISVFFLSTVQGSPKGAECKYLALNFKTAGVWIAVTQQALTSVVVLFVNGLCVTSGKSRLIVEWKSVSLFLHSPPPLCSHQTTYQDGLLQRGRGIVLFVTHLWIYTWAKRECDWNLGTGYCILTVGKWHLFPFFTSFLRTIRRKCAIRYVPHNPPRWSVWHEMSHCH